VAVVDGKEDRTFYEAIGEPQFSPDGNRVAYAAQRGGKWVVVVDDKAGATYDAVMPGRFFSPDSRRVVYGAQRKGKMVLVVDGRETGREYDAIRQVVFDDHGRPQFAALCGDTLLAVTYSGN
jgi:Tol biopolymer transport system component